MNIFIIDDHLYNYTNYFKNTQYINSTSSAAISEIFYYRIFSAIFV